MGAVLGSLEAPGGDILSMVQNLAGGGGFQQIDAAQQRGLAGAGSADDGGYIALVHNEVDVPQYLVIAKGFGKVIHL